MNRVALNDLEWPHLRHCLIWMTLSQLRYLATRGPTEQKNDLKSCSVIVLYFCNISNNQISSLYRTDRIICRSSVYKFY